MQLKTIDKIHINVHVASVFVYEIPRIFCFDFTLSSEFYRICSKWPSRISTQWRLTMDPVTLRMFPGVSRICWKACSILNLGISTFSIAAFALCTKFVISHKRRQLEQMSIRTFLTVFNCTISFSSGSYMFPYTLAIILFDLSKNPKVSL